MSFSVNGLNRGSPSIYDSIATTQQSVSNAATQAKAKGLESAITEKVENDLKPEPPKPKPKKMGFFESIGNFFKKIGEGIKKAFETVVKAVKEAVNKIVDAVKTVVKAAVNAVTKIVAKAVEAIAGEKAGKAFEEGVKKVTDKVIDGVAKAIKKVQEFVIDAVANVARSAIKAMQAASAILQGEGGIKGVLKNLGKLVMNVADVAMTVGTGGAAGVVTGAIKAGAKKVAAAVGPKVSKVMTGAKTAEKSSVKNNAVNTFDKTRAKAHEMGQKFDSMNIKASDKFDESVNKIRNKTPFKVNANSTRPSDRVKDFLEERAQVAAEELANTAASKLESTIGETGSNLVGAVGGQLAGEGVTRTFDRINDPNGTSDQASGSKRRGHKAPDVGVTPNNEGKVTQSEAEAKPRVEPSKSKEEEAQVEDEEAIASGQAFEDLLAMLRNKNIEHSSSDDNEPKSKVSFFDSAIELLIQDKAKQARPEVNRSA